ncbi:electron transporter RsxA [Buchnera aphidicola (Schlechtendalia chinensis)]|uniref:Ion-translocating oxidoreductase complex subunit A n=1 Tax=Buchnera aphidicola subsp. Schlechtendalia chinensis TaxID=118110 RepID=A0A172WD80_BUCSC|nr:electron transport complex subunit RsxA [Buchnera aphidicola]ANF16920.1 electron transporter RsxA [Buchnera aphidicola (Schlechtendalia chinensis)]
MNYFSFFLSNILVNNLVLTQFLGLCPFMGTSKKFVSAMGLGCATVFVITCTSIIIYLINSHVLVLLNLECLRIMTYMLIISVSVQIVEIIMRKVSPVLYRLLGIYLSLITSNCSVLAIPLLSLHLNFSFFESFLYGLSSSIGFLLILVIFSSIRERLSLSDVPILFRGNPIALITASLMSVAFMGFSGLVKT